MSEHNDRCGARSAMDRIDLVKGNWPMMDMICQIQTLLEQKEPRPDVNHEELLIQLGKATKDIRRALEALKSVLGRS